MKSEQTPSSQDEGKLNQIMVSAREAIREGLKKAGDIIGTAGDKVEHAGLKRFGDWIERVGKTIEHLGEREVETGFEGSPGMRTGEPSSQSSTDRTGT